MLAAAQSEPAALREVAATHAQWYDPAAALALRREDPLEEARKALLADFARAEREFLVRQTRELQARIEKSGWSATFREARAREQQQVDRAKAIGWIGTISAGLVPVPGATVGSYLLMSAAYQAWSTMLVTALMNSGHDDIVLEDVGSHPMSAGSLDDLRRKLAGIYVERFPARE